MHPQAIVYNAKAENIPFLSDLGFDLQTDVISLDLNDPNGYGWDIAADIEDRESIRLLTQQLIPKRSDAAAFWYHCAQHLLEDIIISLRNAGRSAGKEPFWTLQELVKVASNEDDIKDALRWHDNSEEVISQHFGLAPAQISSVIMTLRVCMREYDLVAQRWSMAEQEREPLSLKRWLSCERRSVLVLPCAEMSGDKNVFQRLSWAMLDCLTRFIDGHSGELLPKRYFFLDNTDFAAEFDRLALLVSRCRQLAVEVFLDPLNPDSTATLHHRV